MKYTAAVELAILVVVQDEAVVELADDADVSFHYLSNW